MFDEQIEESLKSQLAETRKSLNEVETLIQQQGEETEELRELKEQLRNSIQRLEDSLELVRSDRQEDGSDEGTTSDEESVEGR